MCERLGALLLKQNVEKENSSFYSGETGRHLFNQVVKVNTSGWSHVISYPLMWGSGELYFISGSLCKNSQPQTNQEKTSAQYKLRPSWKYVTSTPQNCEHHEKQGKTEKLPLHSLFGRRHLSTQFTKPDTWRFSGEGRRVTLDSSDFTSIYFTSPCTFDLAFQHTLFAPWAITAFVQLSWGYTFWAPPLLEKAQKV